LITTRAPRPKNWHRFLKQIWPNDTESIRALQEFIGYLLTPLTYFQKILMIIGPKRAGKGTIGRIIRRLLGARNVCNPTLLDISQPFGRAVLIGKTLALISDARIDRRADTSAITERLLSISGEDPQTIPRKFLPDWNGCLPIRFIILTNELPKIEDSSATLASRFIILPLTKSFYAREDHGLFDRLIPELPGILLWALEGRQRLLKRRRFIQPKSSTELIQQFEDLGSPVRAFVRDKCVTGSKNQEEARLFFEAWKTWCIQNGRDRPGTVQIFGKNLHSCVPGMKVTRPRIDGVQVMYYEGIRLKTLEELKNDNGECE
jgi:putative DNA primase/helicase